MDAALFIYFSSDLDCIVGLGTLWYSFFNELVEKSSNNHFKTKVAIPRGGVYGRYSITSKSTEFNFH